ncbi:MAG: hypothetical protein ACK5V1_07025, partial [Planctomycetaceae bacterium]
DRYDLVRFRWAGKLTRLFRLAPPLVAWPSWPGPLLENLPSSTGSSLPDSAPARPVSLSIPPCPGWLVTDDALFALR